MDEYGGWSGGDRAGSVYIPTLCTPVPPKCLHFLPPILGIPLPPPHPSSLLLESQMSNNIQPQALRKLQ